MSRDHVQIGVGVMIRREDGRVLLGHRRAGKEKKDSWTFPGGTPEIGESLYEAGVREVEEETGLTVLKMDFLGLIDDFDGAGHQHWVTANFLCRSFEGDVTTREPEKFREWKWFEFAKVPTSLFPPAQGTIDCFQNEGFYIEKND